MNRVIKSLGDFGRNSAYKSKEHGHNMSKPHFLELELENEVKETTALPNKPGKETFSKPMRPKLAASCDDPGSVALESPSPSPANCS